MPPEAVANDTTRTTAERILDAAEDLFAAKGYAATSLGEVADEVGIRSPSLYNHFRNKSALYAAVLDRLLDDFSEPVQALTRPPETLQKEYILQCLEVIVRKHYAKPNLARLLQHAALSGGPHTNEIMDRLFRPLFEPVEADQGQAMPQLLGDTGLQPWGVMAFNNLVMSYITMAPMYQELLGQDPFSEEAVEQQLRLIRSLLQVVFDYQA